MLDKIEQVKLQIGDKIQRYEFDKPKGSVYVVKKVTKTLAKCDDDVSFFRPISKSNNVERKDDFWSLNKKYIKITEDVK